MLLWLGSEELSELVKSVLQRGKELPLSPTLSQRSTDCVVGWMYSISEYSGKALQLAKRWDRIFLCVFELYIFTCFNIWCMRIRTLLFSIEHRGWAWIIHSLFIFSQHEHDSQGWGRGWSTSKPRKDSPLSVLAGCPVHFYTASLSEWNSLDSTSVTELYKYLDNNGLAPHW